MAPAIARLLCHLTEAEIAKRAGLSLSTVRRISQQGSWHQLETVSAFLDGCGIEVRVTIPALRKVKRIMNSKKGLSGIKIPKARGQKAKAIMRVIKALK